MIKITNIEGSAYEGKGGNVSKPLNKNQQKYIVKRIKELLQDIEVYADVKIE